MKYDIAIVGGGIIGCASAYYLARHGASVLLLEKGRVGDQATGASAGMLAPVAEAKRPGAFLDLVVGALRDYPSAVREVECASGLSTGYNQRSILRVAFSAEDEEKFALALPMYELANLPYKQLDGDSARTEEPALGAGVISAILSPQEGQVLPRQLVQAYRHAAGLLGATFREDTEVTAIYPGALTVSVETLGGKIEADRVVVAAGAWSSRFGGCLGTTIPVFPVRGQIAAIKGLPLPVRHVLYSYGGYAVPWPDGRLLVGATQEEAGYAPHTSVEGIQQILAGGRRLVPSVAYGEIDDLWAGLRPGSPDTMPFLGPAVGQERVWLATGHYRNGVLLGPYTSRLLAESMTDGRVSDALRPFLPGRTR